MLRRSSGMVTDSRISKHVSNSWAVVWRWHPVPVKGRGLCVTFLRSRMTSISEPKPITLLLVDDHEVLRIGLRTLFTEAGNFQVVGEAGTMAAAVTDALRLNPNVILMDVRLPDGSG